MSNDHPVAPVPPRRVHSGQRAEAAAATARPQRIRRISSGDRASEANGGPSVLPEPPRRLVRRTTTTRP